jgi:hypothetical protein
MSILTGFGGISSALKPKKKPQNGLNGDQQQERNAAFC